jgi:hypothetical protein
LFQRCCGLECYSYVGIFEQIYDSSYFGAMVCECGPNFVFLFVVYVISFALYLMVYEVSVMESCSLLWFVLFFILFVSCLDPEVGSAFGLCEI